MKTILSSTMSDLHNIQSKSDVEQRFMWFSGKLEKTCTECYIKEDEQWIVFADMVYKIMFNKKLFVLPKAQKGFSYNKITKEFKLWFQTNLQSLTKLKEFFVIYKKEWVVDSKLLPFLTKGLIERIVNGTITNPTDACKYIIKMNRLGKATSVKFLLRWVMEGNSKHDLMRAKFCAKDLNHFLNPLDNKLGVNNIVDDCFKQAAILQEKIDFKWSKNRLNDVHNQWTKQIMAMEIDFIGSATVSYKKLPALPQNIEVIQTQKRLFEEGFNMKHCIYTNYLTQWKRGDYLVLHFKGTDPITVGLCLNVESKAEVDQMYHKSNREVNGLEELHVRGVINPHLKKLTTSMKSVKKQRQLFITNI